MNKKVCGKKKALKIIISILSVIVVFVAATQLVGYIGYKSNLKKAQSFDNAGTRQLDFENYATGYWNIYTDSDIKVMQLTDIHLGGGAFSISKDLKALNAVAAMITEEKPDFVIATGDLIYPMIIQAGTINNSCGARLFAELMESLGVYWTYTFGNHDVEVHSLYSKAELNEIFSEYPHCFAQTVEGIDGYTNKLYNIVNSDGVITRSLVLLDSHDYTDGYIPGISFKYDNIHENQVEWYKETVLSLNGKNEQIISSLNDEKQKEYAQLTTVPSSVYFHIPIREYSDAWTEFSANDYLDTENVKYNYGLAGEDEETVYCGEGEDNLFEYMLELGSTDSAFCGHDHYNIFSVNYKGINLSYGMYIDYLAYFGIKNKGSQRGCTMITYYKDGNMEFKQENYYQDKYEPVYEKETVTMQFEGISY
ncbi:MAG: metallophosphoesterase [Clostridia bacterium]|nr:metallophosphoesterase [Clostridia bacterium]